MSATLGISVGQGTVHAALVNRGAIRWAGHATYHTLSDLREALARLVAECTERPHRSRVVLERSLVQFRTLTPVPPVRASALAAYVALEAPRLFRNGSGPLVTDAAVRTAAGRRALWAAAADEALVRAVRDACYEAGLAVEALGPASDVWCAALVAVPTEGAFAILNGGSTERLEVAGAQPSRSRLVAGVEGVAPPLVPALAALGPDAVQLAPAYAAAVRLPQLHFEGRDARAARERRARQARRWLALAAACLWALAATAYTARLSLAAGSGQRELRALGPSVDSALELRRDLDAARDVLGTVRRAEAARSAHLALLAALAVALPDSCVLVALRVAPDSSVRLAGYAASGARILAALERVPALTGVRLEGPLTREAIGGSANSSRSWDRFAIVARQAVRP